MIVKKCKRTGTDISCFGKSSSKPESSSFCYKQVMMSGQVCSMNSLIGLSVPLDNSLQLTRAQTIL